MAWNLSIPPDPGRPLLNPEGEVLFAACAREAGWTGLDLSRLPLLYWPGLIPNTWPAALRYRSTDGAVSADWQEILAMRFRAAVWLGDRADPMSD